MTPLTDLLRRVEVELGVKLVREIRLSKLEAQTLMAWQEDNGEPMLEGYCLPFRSVHRRSGTPQHLVRRVVRALARKGITEFHKGLWSEDGDIIGSGYGLTPVGRQTLRALIARSGSSQSSVPARC